ncbi:MAG: VTT domain-containing protein [Thermodesulfobacteriota bacterium]
MPRLSPRQYILASLVILFVGGLLLFFSQEGLLTRIITQLKDFKSQSDNLRAEILAHGSNAPLFFIGIQIFQVIFAPIPGEASGLVGGYLFGTWPCTLYSTIGLTVGSAIAFGGGRLLSSFFTEKFRHTKLYQRFNHLVSRGDYLLPFVLFIFPGFPKDSLCYLLGMSAMPLPVFMFLTTVGRFPGTMLLSANGAEAYNGDLVRLGTTILLSAILVAPAMIFRHRLLEILKRRQAKAADKIQQDSEKP